MQCPRCNANLKDDLKFCNNCGFKIEDQRIEEGNRCHNCGVEITGNAKFCSKCGATVVGEVKANPINTVSPASTVNTSNPASSINTTNLVRTVKTTEAKDNKGTLVKVSIAIGILVIVAAGSLIYYFNFVKKDKETPPNNSVTSSNTTTENSKNNNGTTNSNNGGLNIANPNASQGTGQNTGQGGTSTSISGGQGNNVSGKDLEKKKIDFDALQGILRQDPSGGYSLYVRYVSDSSSQVEYFNNEANTLKPAGGLVYIPIMVTTLSKYYNGWLSLDKTVTVRSIAGGTGKLAQQDIGRRFTIKELLELMMMYSDNTAANLLIDEIGGIQAINNQMRDFGLDGIEVNRRLMDQAAINRGIENYCSSRSMGQLLSLLLDCRIMSPRECSYALDIMRKSDHKGIDAYMPDSIPVSHQTGILTGVFNDAGIINSPAGPIVVVGMGTNVEENKASDILGKVAKAVVEQVQK